MRARHVNEEYEEEKNQFDFIIDDIFFIWDKWEDDERKGIEVQRRGTPGGYQEFKFYFPEGWSDDFYVDVEEFLKDFRIKNFGKHTPFEWEWFENFLLINTIY